MSRTQLFRSPAPALLVAILAACGGPVTRDGSGADPYNGVIDNTFGQPSFTGTNTTPQGALAAIFQPTSVASTDRTTCNGARSCYLPVPGYVNGKVISFFVAGRIFGTKPPYTYPYAPSIADHGSDLGGGWHADSFPHSCTAKPYDQRLDAFKRDQQFPIANALPTNNANISGARPPVGVVAVYGVTGVSGETCNDLKYADSIANFTDSSAGSFGARRTEKPIGYEVWMIFDPSVVVLSAAGGTVLDVPSFWFRGLLANYLSGGRIPQDAQGNLTGMDGVILDPTGSAFALPTDAKAVLLPYQPGDDGYSPIVRLHDYHLPSGKKLGDYTGVCPVGVTTCPANFVKLSDAGNVFNTILIAASPQ